MYCTVLKCKCTWLLSDLLEGVEGHLFLGNTLSEPDWEGTITQTRRYRIS